MVKSSGPRYASKEARRANKRLDELFLPPGAPGNPGPSGISAYQVALNNGFVGTEAQWLLSLVGIQGIQGNPGAQGIQGLTGADGLPNVTGMSTSPGRAFNTNFVPHATRPSVCIYAVQLHTVLTAIGTSFAQVDLLCDPSGTPTTLCGRVKHQRVLGLGISINEQSDVICSAYSLIPPGYVVRLVPSTGNGGTATFVAQTEIIL